MKKIKTKKQAEDFCNRYIRIIKAHVIFDVQYAGDIIPCCPHDMSCHLFRGVRKLAELLECETYEIVSSDIITYICFNYRDVKFFEITNRRSENDN